MILMQANQFLKNKVINRLNARFLKFCVVGSSGVIVNMGLLWILTEKVGLYYLISSGIGIETSIITNFIFNDMWTWKEVGGNRLRERLGRAVKFNIICATGLIVNVAILWSMTEILGVYYLTSNLFGIGGAVLWNYFLNDTVTWKN